MWQRRTSAWVLLPILMAVIIAGCSPNGSSPTSPTKIHEASAPDKPFALEEGFTAMSLKDFEQYPAEAETWSATETGLKCSGKPRGYLYSKESLNDFTWRLEYRFPKPDDLEDETKFKGNTGFMVFIAGEHKVWPLSLEVQGKHVQMGTIKANGGETQPEISDDETARQAARRPVGEWNRMEIVAKEGTLTVKLNDRLVCTSQTILRSDGLIGIQAEDHPFEVRHLRIRKDQPAEKTEKE